MKLTEQDLVNAHRACSDGKHEFFDKIEVVAWWPRGVCTSTSLITVPHVRYHCPNFNWEVILGFVLENRIHCWIESDDGHIVDPTYGQFDEGDAVRVWEAQKRPEHFQVRIRLTRDAEDEARKSIQPDFGGTMLKQVFREIGGN